MRRYIQSAIQRAFKTLGDTKAKLVVFTTEFSERTRRYYAVASIRSAWLGFKWQRFAQPLKPAARIFLVVLAVSLSVWASDWLHTLAAPFFPAGSPRTAALWSLLTQLGSALIAVLAISFSVAIFAQQINVNRMPHGLFWRFTADARIMWAFAGVFALAVGVALTGLIQDPARVGLAITIAGWCVLLIFILTVYAFRRSLFLINPVMQLSIVLADITRELRHWAKRAERARPLLQRKNEDKSQANTASQRSVDTSRTLYFQLNRHWTDTAGRGLGYAIAFARRYAEQGDYQVTSAALSVVIAINEQYVKAKGRTFFSTNLLVENPLSTDGFITGSLEQLRQLANISLARRDEQQATQVLTTLSRLVEVYLEIDYGDQFAPKFHAHLASGYLSSAVELTVQHKLTDLTMEGLRLLSRCGLLFIKSADTEDLATISEKIGMVGAAGIADEQTRPITLTAVAELSNLSVALLRSQHRRDISFAMKKLTGDISFIAKLLLQVPDIPFISAHSANLAPHYSMTSSGGFLQQLTDLVNAVAGATEDDEAAKNVVRNLEGWSEDAYSPARELFKLSIAKRSKFTFDLIHWIAHVSKVLLAVARAAACDHYNREKLEKHALWLISTLSFVGDDKESVAHAERYQLGETLFEVALDAHRRGFDEFSQQVGNLLVRWGLRSGQYESGWASLERSLCGAAAIAAAFGGETVLAGFKKIIAKHLEQAAPVNEEERVRVARRLLQLAEDGPNRAEFNLSRFDRELGRADASALALALKEIANALSPPQ